MEKRQAAKSTFRKSFRAMSDAIEKTTEIISDVQRAKNITECNNLCFMGSTVVSGSATGVVFATG